MLENFFVKEQWGSAVEQEVRRRIRLAVAAYAYEFRSTSIMSDAEFDKLSYEVDLSITTSNAKMDKFFKEHFDPSTGQWIHRHPELNKVAKLFSKYYQSRG